MRQSGDTLEFHVLDRGPGVPPDMLELVFEPFTQADALTGRGQGGMGLGLAISPIGSQDEPGSITSWSGASIRSASS